MRSVFLADDNKEWLDILELGINRNENFHVVGKAYNGRDTIESIKMLRPEIILLDIIMPEFDGVYIVNHIRQAIPRYRPIIYILSGIGTNTIIKIFNDLDVDFYSMKPVTLEIIIDTLTKIISCQKADRAKSDGDFAPLAADPYRQRIKEVLFFLGMPSHLFSSKCMAETISIYMSDPEYCQLLTKKLYPQVAKTFQVSSSAVEKNLRNAIAQMQKNKTDLLLKLFPYYTDKKISNGEFLSVISDYMQHQQVSI